jgi:hypothetical protein
MQLINNEFYAIYVIQLEKHKIYVFKTRNHTITKHNILQSPDLNLNAWVKLYKPLEVIDIFYTHDENADTNEVKEYMKLHGVSNVRGGIYQDIEIEKTELMAPLIEELTQPFNPCLLCGKTNHLTACCPSFTKYNDYEEYNITLKLWRDDYAKWKHEHEQKWNAYYNELQQWTQNQYKLQMEQYEWYMKMQLWVSQNTQTVLHQPCNEIKHNSYGHKKYKKY